MGIRNYIKKLFYKASFRIYNAGLVEYNFRQTQQLKNAAVFGDKTIFHEGYRVMNLSGNSERINLGSNCHIYGLLIVYNYSGQIKMGNNCSVGEYSRIVSGLNITIGNRVMIAHNVNIIDNISHPKDAALRHEDFMAAYSGGSKPYDLDFKEVVIEDDVWIGFNSIILKGVRIGRGAIIGAGSIVTKDVEPWTVNVGNPLRCVQKLETKNF